ncbi:MAG: tail fiber protein, partial [Planctomycetota bacterium]
MSVYRYFAVAFSLTVASTASAMTTLPAGGGVPFRNEAPSLGLRYLINVDGGAIDAGEVALYAGRDTNRPTGWLPAEGQLLPIAGNETLFDKLQTTFGGDGVNDFALPDLRGRTVIGTGARPGASAFVLGDTIGSETVTLTDLPAHSHALSAGLETDPVGSRVPHSNWQPSLALTPIIATQGQFPSRSLVAPLDEAPSADIGSPGAGPLLGQMTWLAHDEVPSGWAVADGTLLDINSNQSLFSLLGAQYGGDGRTTFALPDLRGRAPTGSSGSVRVGLAFGSETETLIAAQLPNHTHDLPN